MDSFEYARGLALQEIAAGNIRRIHIDAGIIDAESMDGGWFAWYRPADPFDNHGPDMSGY